MNNVYVPMTFLPFEEASANKTLANFIKYVGANKVSGFAVYGWTSTLAFAQAVRAAVAKSGQNGLTRSALLDGAKTLTAFNAGGMIGKTDIAHKTQTACTAMVQLRNDKWVRVYPSKPGTFDCTASNHVEFKADLING
jgi:Periplasmic binding protein